MSWTSMASGHRCECASTSHVTQNSDHGYVIYRLKSVMSTNWVDSTFDRLRRALLAIKSKTKDGSMMYTDFREQHVEIQRAFTSIYMSRSYRQEGHLSDDILHLIELLVRAPEGSTYLNAAESPEDVIWRTDETRRLMKKLGDIGTEALQSMDLGEDVQPALGSRDILDLGGLSADTGVVAGKPSPFLCERSVSSSIEQRPLLHTVWPDQCRLTAHMPDLEPVNPDSPAGQLIVPACSSFDPKTNEIEIVWPLSSLRGGFDVRSHIRLKCPAPGCGHVTDS